ncbi:DUF4870 family protein [Paraferrimonas sedimenticola]|uniref:DUF4870 domain-containing protein n=1 Tax=Paraferrimonas sedimenticola TaxID=375674 RepID=A0AA37RWD9_9GAMM|nr:hypothetical protein [Paraferrimonas sedimenticola]GLP95962.1 hypothetical protein GCM10007895_12680 [Paraferrimonas sedimenticola]
MNIEQGTSNDLTSKEAALNNDSKNFGIISYVFMILGLFTLFLGIIGVILAYVKRGSDSCSVMNSHYDNIIGVFWKGLILAIAAFIGILIGTGFGATGNWFGLVIAFVGYLLLFAVWIWEIYRMVKGVVKLSEGAHYPF